ncbi:Cobalt-zinc-cadmium resistance protein CzcC precursor [Rubripirellula lacrimiformis]|uniref:Cobalt-zinc-cadmium resistance protein CzcC n=1 Tax=Rubripirellula lacrimiformis TaxID=1930273 RepID=A0A517NKH3_9BACT|nr:TolC family protein [Rubripirellula lacrimiformis]QDT07579.1 Cobalt-zinc-cadmium resistance protein CzcC precursor [Rubripirellula lacrimiformis]
MIQRHIAARGLSAILLTGITAVATPVPGNAADWFQADLASESAVTPDIDRTGAGIPEQSLRIDPVVIDPIDSPSFDPADTASASDQFSGYSLADIESIALQNNPTIRAANAIAAKSEALRYQVGIRPNPILGYFGQQLGDESTDQHGLFIEQEFVRGDKLAINRQVLGHTAAAQHSETMTQKQRVLTDIRIRFYEAMAAQQQRDATLDFAKVANRGVEVAVDRRGAQEGTLIEVLQAKTLLSEVKLAAQQADAVHRGAWRDLASIAGLPEQTPMHLNDTLAKPDGVPDWELVYQEIVASSPEIAVANSIVCEKQSLLKRQKVQMKPNVTAQLGAGYDNGTNSGMINLQLSAPIPVWNQNSGNISAAYADYSRASENVKRIEQQIRSRLARTSQDFDSAWAAVNQYETEIIPQARESLELSEEAYEAGELEFLQVLIVRRSFYESTIRMIQARGNLAQASAKIDGLLLTGGLDTPQDYTDGDGIRGQSFGGQ